MRKGGSYIINAKGEEPKRVAYTKPQPGPTRLLDADGRPLQLRPDEAIAEDARRGPLLNADGSPRPAGAEVPGGRKADKTKAEKDGKK
ncbi:MAG: hypothetical protein MJA83_06505 [Gammaproteobacteria bacterium]|nr:hypothetical protein [Gammaproteobacteria bacterium]